MDRILQECAFHRSATSRCDKTCRPRVRSSSLTDLFPQGKHGAPPGMPLSAFVSVPQTLNAIDITN
jgi:hypothetical protein